LSRADPDRYVLLQQFQNPANPAIHVTTTGPRSGTITDGRVDVLVAGSARAAPLPEFRATSKLERKRKIISIGVEPEGSPVIAQTLAGEPIQPGPHGIQESGCGIHSGHAGLEMVDRIELAGDEESIEMGEGCPRRGHHQRISCGAAVAAAVRVRARARDAGENDGGDSAGFGRTVLDVVLFDGLSD